MEQEYQRMLTNKKTKKRGVVLFHHKGACTVVPFGISGFKKEVPENANFVFEYHLNETAIEKLSFEILNTEGTVFFNLELKGDFLKQGRHKIFWDGFDSNGIYNSQQFSDKILRARLTAVKIKVKYVDVIQFHTAYKEVEWVDVRIDKNLKRIEFTLRTNFKDGGVKGLPGQGEVIDGFQFLLRLAKDGIQYHWSRNRHHAVGQNIEVQKGLFYEVYVHVQQSSENALRSPMIVYHTNGKNLRSRNWELSRILYYNIGRIKYGQKWYQINKAMASIEFKYTAAHEIGHEILLAYGGHLYSKGHKGSSTIVSQSALGNFLYPSIGEIDLMVYYVEDLTHPYPMDYNRRVIAAEQDVIGLLWLTKIKIV